MIDTKTTPSHEYGFETWGSIPYDEWVQRATEIMSKLYAKTVADTPEQVTEMYVLYNDKYRPTYSSRSCSSCVQNVHRRMSMWYKKNVLDKIDLAVAEAKYAEATALKAGMPGATMEELTQRANEKEFLKNQPLQSLEEVKKKTRKK